MSQFQSIFSQKNSLKEQNDQLKAKYKKSLQELMHILKVNKSLKQFLDQNTQNTENSIQEQINSLRIIHGKEIQSYVDQIQQYKLLVIQANEKYKELQQILSVKQAQASKDQILIKQLGQKIEQLQILHSYQSSKSQNNEQSNKTMIENDLLKRKILKLLEIPKEKQIMERQNEELKNKLKELNIQLIKQKQRYRNQIFSKENQLIKSKEEDHFRLNTIQSKYQLLQNELHHYKSIEKYFQEESRSIIDEEFIYNSIKEQITRINQDFNKYEEESSYLLLKKRQQNNERNKRLTELQNEVNSYKDKEVKYKQRNQQIQHFKLQISGLKNQLKSISMDNNELLKKNLILQALKITQKHRYNTGLSHRIYEFEERIRLLLSESPNNEYSSGGLQQIIILKEYITQLNSILVKSKKKEEYLSSKIQNKKQKIEKIQNHYKEKMREYKQKLYNYDILINKLYKLLEEKLKEKMPEEIQKDFNITISYYEEKMMMMSEEILKLRKNKKQLQNLKNSAGQTDIKYLQRQNESFKQIISDLSVKINELNEQKRKEAEQNTKYRDLLTQFQLKENEMNTSSLQINQSLYRQRQLTNQLQNNKIIIIHYQKMLQENKRQIQLKSQEIFKLSNRTYDVTSLLQMIESIKFQLKREEVTNIQNEKILKLVIKDLQNRLKNHQHEIHQLQGNKKTIDMSNYYQIVQKLSLENNQLRDKIDRIEDSSSMYTQSMDFKNEQEKMAKKMYEYELKMNELEKRMQQNDLRSNIEIKQLNSNIISQRTTNMSMRNQLQSREDTINQLKHQLFTIELQAQKQRSSASVGRQSSGYASNQGNEKLLMIIALLSAQVEQLRTKKEELQYMYHQDLDKYREALKLLENKQLQLCNSLQYSSHKEADDMIHKSQEEISLKFQSNSNISHAGTNLGFKTQQNLMGTFSGSKKNSQQKLSSDKLILGPYGQQLSPHRKSGLTIKKKLM